MSKTHFDHLFEPLQVGPMTVPNRICETTNTINSSMVPDARRQFYTAHHVARPAAVLAGLVVKPGC